MDSINKGVECLTSYDYNTALFYAKELDQINAERRNREVSMQSDAILSLQTISVDDSNSIVLEGDDWHAGIIGLVASRIKEQTYRPVIALLRRKKTVNTSSKVRDGLSPAFICAMP